MTVSVKVVDTVPLEVNTPEDLEQVRKAFAQTIAR
jgi:CMP-2-keto-3-deoxyoctulosonic acid synthetase